MSTSTADANAGLVKLLSDNEDYVLSLIKSKAVDLSEKMFRNFLISDSMMDTFSSLDHSRVEHQLQLRYLLRLVNQRIQQDESEGDRFLNLLESWKEQPLCEYLKRNNSPEEQPVAERNRLDDCLSSDDMAWLLELLIDASQKWDDLAIALGFRMYQRNNIEGANNIDKLKKVLDIWLSGGSTTPLTVNTLTDALRSKLVGQGRLALELEQQYRASTTANKASNIKIHHSTNFPFTTFYQSPRKVEVEDGKSTILFTQVSNRENVSYQWNKNGQAIVDNSSSHVADQQHYFGVNEDMLFINHAHQGIQGEYTCYVSNEERQVVSNKVTLTVLYTPEKKVLLDKYSSAKSRVSLDEAWPPVGAETFIKLVLIKSSELAINSSSYSIDKNPDKVIDNKKEIEYEEVFTAYRSASFLLIEGRPGSGKTTLVCKLIKDWTEGITLVQAKLVFLVSLRTLKNDHSQTNTLSKLLQQFYSSCATLKAVVLDIEKNNGEGVCFVFDGLDEYHPHRVDESVVFRILYRRYLSQAMIIVSSRPEAKARLRMAVVNQHIEVLGFTESQIAEYIDNFPFDSSSGSSFGSSELKAYLKLHPNVLHMCYLPIHVAIICFVYNIKRGHLPHTQTKIYEEFTKAMILHHLKRSNLEVQLHSLKELPDDVREFFSKLCLLAFDMTLKFKQVIDSNEITFPLNRDTSFRGDWSLGLVTCNRTAQLSGVSTSYMFLHLTLQEYLAAYYITSAEQEKKRQLIQRLISKSTFASVFTFCFGLETFQSQKDLDCYRQVLAKHRFMDELIRYAFESQEQIVCDEVIKKLCGSIIMTFLKRSDVPAFQFVIRKTAPIIRKIMVSEYNRDSVVSELFDQIRPMKFPELESLSIISMSVNTETFQHLSTILEFCGNLRDLELNFGILSKEGGDIIANSLKYIKKLKCLKFSPLQSTGQSLGLLTVIKHIHCLNQLKSLDLSGCILDPQCCEVLASNICHLTSLKKLYLMRKEINPDSVFIMTSGLHRHIELQLNHNTIGSEGATILAPALYHLTELEILDLSCNSIGAVGATSLASALPNLTNLVSLLMRETAIGSEGAISLASVLPHLTKLEYLDLDSNNIGSDGATALASGLCHLTEVKMLFLSRNGIDAHSAILIIKALKDCQKLKHVMLNKNIEYDGRSDKGVYLKGLITSDESAAIDDLVAAARLHKRDIDLHLGFKTIKIQHKWSFESLTTLPQSVCRNM